MVVFFEKVINASTSQFGLPISVSREGLRRRNYIQFIGLAVLSGGTVYPGKKKSQK